MNIRDIVLEKIAAVGADGLCCDTCGCGTNDEDFMDYQCMVSHQCRLAKVVRKKEFCNPKNCDCCMMDCDGYSNVSSNAVRYIPLNYGVDGADIESRIS